MFWVTLFFMPLMLVYRLVDSGSPLFMIGMFGIFFQLGLLLGPLFGTIQELVQPQIRGTVTAVALFMINVFGTGLGVTAGGILVDWMIAAGIEDPYTKSMAFFVCISVVTVPLFFFAGRHCERDKAALRQYLLGEGA